jgi:hypothetical protein
VLCRFATPLQRDGSKDRNAYELAAPVVFDQDREPFQGALGQLEHERAVRRTLAALVLAQRELRQVGIEPTLHVAFLHAHDTLGCDAEVELAALIGSRLSALSRQPSAPEISESGKSDEKRTPDPLADG